MMESKMTRSGLDDVDFSPKPCLAQQRIEWRHSGVAKILAVVAVKLKVGAVPGGDKLHTLLERLDGHSPSMYMTRQGHPAAQAQFRNPTPLAQDAPNSAPNSVLPTPVSPMTNHLDVVQRTPPSK
jgi:hypothetical protein